MNLGEFIELLHRGEDEHLEFKIKVTRDIGEEICGFANADGGVILIGVDDDGVPIGCDIKKSKESITSYISSITPPPSIHLETMDINGKKILIIRVEKSNMLCTIGGVAYIRVGTGKRPLSISEIVSLSAEYTIQPIDSMITEVSEEELDENLWREFLDIRRRKGFREVDNLREKLGVIKRKDGRRYLTLAGYLFFNSRPQDTLPHTYIRMKTAEGWIRIDGAVWRMIEKTIENIKEYLLRRSTIEGIYRRDMIWIPDRVLREAIVNAVTHRNYAIHSEIFIEVSPTKIVIKNPGSFPPGTTPEDPKPIPRNPVLYELMFEVGLVERQGSGIEMMRQICRDDKIKMEIISKDMFTTAVFEITMENLLDELELKILELLSSGEMNSSEIAEKLGVSKPTILKRVEKLVSLGYIESLGRGPTTRYRKIM